MKDRDFDLEVFFDGDCPLCHREIEFIRKRDRKQRIRFTDIAQFQNCESGSTPGYEHMMALIHARAPDGTWIKGVEVFRRMYEAIGWRRLVVASRWAVVNKILDVAFDLFAKNRLKITGRETTGRCSEVAE